MQVCQSTLQSFILFITFELVSANTALTSPFKVSLRCHPDLCLSLGQPHNTDDIRHKTYTMPLYDSTAIKAFHSDMCPFSLNIHKCTYLRPSHLRLTLFLYTKASFDMGRFPYLTSKSAGLSKDIWKNVLKQMI